MSSYLSTMITEALLLKVTKVLSVENWGKPSTFLKAAPFRQIFKNQNFKHAISWPRVGATFSLNFDAIGPLVFAFTRLIVEIFFFCISKTKKKFKKLETVRCS